MDYETFKSSLKSENTPENLSSGLLALWLDAKGKWELAHEMAQQVPDPEGAWVHAYLHRVEGDLSNATYWYERAKKEVCNLGLQEEWESIVRDLLKDYR